MTGQTPFVAPPNTEPDLLYYLNAHLHRPPPRPSDHASAAALADLARLDPVVARGMAKLPTERYASAGELAAAAQTALDTSACNDAGNDSDSSPTVRMPHGFAAPTAPPARSPSPVPRVVSTVAGRTEWVGAPADPTPSDASPAAHGARPLAPPMPAPPMPFPAEHRYRQVVESRPARPPAPPTAPTTKPPGSGAARRRRIRMGHRGADLHARPDRGGAGLGEPPQNGDGSAASDHAAAPTIEHTLTGHTNWVFGVATAQLDGRTGGGLRQRRRHGAGVGPGHRDTDRVPVHRPHRPRVRGGDRAAGRAHRGDLRQRGQDGAGVGPGHRDSRSGARSPATPAPCSRWRPRSSTGAPW